MNITCQVLKTGKLLCNGSEYDLAEDPLGIHDEWFWIYIGIYVALVLFAGVCSGLTIGLLSLDLMSLQILQDAGSEKEKKQASRILPVVKRHHLLLVTLLLANAAAVESMPLFLDKVSDPITAILVSVTAVLLFGEVFPQALCSRFGLAIGATLVPLVYVLMALLFIIAYPIAKLLDCLLGEGHTTFFRRAELKALVDYHGPTSPHGQESQGQHGGKDKLSMDEVLIIKGALDLRNKTVANCMVPIESVFKLNIGDKMDRETMLRIQQASHSRIPIYGSGEDKDNIVGILLTKVLMILDPDDEVPILSLQGNKQAFRPVHYVNKDKPLYDVLNEFQTGKSHLFVVKGTTSTNTELQDQAIQGIITLEDVIEELLQEEILDETDVYVDVHKRVQVARAKLMRSTSSQGMQSGEFSNQGPANVNQTSQPEGQQSDASGLDSTETDRLIDI